MEATARMTTRKAPTGFGQHVVTDTTTASANAGFATRVFNDRDRLINRALVHLSVSSGNLDIGVYSDAAGGGTATRIASLGGVASPGTGVRRFIFPAPFWLPAGFYWAGISADNGTIRWGYGATSGAAFGMFDPTTDTYIRGRQIGASAYPLPTTVSIGGAANVAPALHFDHS